MKNKLLKRLFSKLNPKKSSNEKIPFNFEYLKAIDTSDIEFAFQTQGLKSNATLEEIYSNYEKKCKVKSRSFQNRKLSVLLFI